MNIIERKNKLNGYLQTKEVKTRMIALLGDEKKAQKFSAAIINMVLDKSLQYCSIESIAKSAFAIAEAGLPISKALGLAYIVPFKNEAQPIISYKGWKHLLRKEGVLIKAREIYSCDDFRMEYDDFDEHFSLRPSKERDGSEKWIKENLLGIWVAVKYTEINEIENFYVPRGKLDQLANMSQAKNSKYSPYNTGFWLEMYFAKAIGYVARKIGVSGEKIERAFDIENSQTDLSLGAQQEENTEVTEEDIFDIEVEPKEAKEGK